MEMTPVTTSATPKASQEILGLVQSVHPEKLYFYLPGFTNEEALAGIYGLDVETYRAIKARFANAALGGAQELLGDTSFVAAVDRLPIAPGTTVVAIGDSYTDDLQSWFEILRHLLELRRPQDGIRLVNAGVSARTTVE